MKQKLADQIINDEEIDSFDGRVDILLDLARELEDIATDALKSFKCTQRPWEYPKSHWSNRLELLLSAPQKTIEPPDGLAGQSLGAAPCSANPSKWKGRAAFSSAHVEWGTPPDLKDALDKEFRFTLDPCKPGQVWDGRAMSWSGHRVFCNPPYGKGIANWLAKGPEALLAVFLLPARTDTKWFHDHALKADEIRFFRGRLKFKENHIEPDLDHKNAAPFPSMLVIFRRKDWPNVQHETRDE